MAAIAMPRPSHPALLFTPPKSCAATLATTTTSNPAAPTKKSPATTTSTGKITPTTLLPPRANYALLRSHHAIALKYTIGRLRWDQANNGYTPGESAWREHNGVIAVLEDELAAVQAGQKALDKYPDFCQAPVAPLQAKPYGPETKTAMEKAKADAERKDRELDRELDRQFPFIRQLFIGPMTKQQARNDKMLRQQLKEGDLMDLTVLLPSENLRMAMGGGDKKVEKRRPYQEVRLEREKEKIKVILEEQAAAEKVAQAEKGARGEGEDDKKARIGPMTKEEYISTLPVFGPKTRGEALLPMQREQRHVILNFLRKPWPQYDEEAAALLERLGRLAVRRLSQEVRVKGPEEKGVKGNAGVALDSK